jgi:class 3 adenylate cyclase
MAELPGGMVTFLFTDIEGSTRLWEQFPQAMPDAHARHNALLHQVIAEHDGLVFRTVGDAFHAAFVSAGLAVDAALSAQRALATEPWGAVGAIRVRMALHISPIEPRDGDYFGSALSRVARLLEMGHGGQTLLSRSMEEVVRDQLAPGMAVRDLGEHHLRDLVEPEQVFQLIVPDLPADFPPLRLSVHGPSEAIAPVIEQQAGELPHELDAQALQQAKLPGMPKIDYDALWKKERERASQQRSRKRKRNQPDPLF